MPAATPAQVITAQQIQLLSIAYLGRPSDPATITAFRTAGATYQEVAAAFAGSNEYFTTAVQPNSDLNTNGTRAYNDNGLINTIYLRLYGVLASNAEINGWVAALNNPKSGVTYDNLASSMLIAICNQPASNPYQQTLLAKLASASAYTEALRVDASAAAAYSNTAALDAGRAFIDTIVYPDNTPATGAEVALAVSQMVEASSLVTYTFSAAIQAADAGTLAAVYSIESGSQADGGTLDVETAFARLFQVSEIIAGAINAEQLSIENFDFRLSDTFANLTSEAFFGGELLISYADSYRLTDPAGTNLGGLTPSQVAILNGATNGGQYVYAPLNPANQEVIELTRNQFTYVGNDLADTTFIAQLTAENRQTLLNQDRIDGGQGENTLIATLRDSVTPASLINVQTVELTATRPVVLNLQNADDINLVINNGSDDFLRIRNLDEGANLEMLYTDENFQVDFFGAGGAADETTIRLDGVGVLNVPSLVLNATGAIETVNVISDGVDANAIGGGATLDGVTTLNVSGAADFSVTSDLNDVLVVGGGDAFGSLTLSFAQGAVSATGGSGDDLFTVNGLVGNANLNGGQGADTFVFAPGSFNGLDSVVGGLGTDDRLFIDGGDGAVNYSNVSGVEILNVTGQPLAAGNLFLSTDFNIINLLNGTVGITNLLNSGPGTLDVNLGDVLGGAFTVNNFGLLTNDVLDLCNESIALVDIFNGQILNFNGYETVNLNTGDTAVNTPQTTGSITVNPDFAAPGVLNIVGNQSLITNGAIDASTINASALSGTAALTMTVASLNATSITGSNNNDTLFASALGTVITAGTGNDTAVGGASIDTIFAGNGADSVTAAGGADTVNLTEVVAAADAVVQGALDSVVATDSTGPGFYVSGYLLTYGNGVDVVSNFSVANDVLQNVVGNVAPTSAFNLSNTAVFARGIYTLSGTYSAASGRFTVAADGVGPDTIVYQVSGSQTNLVTNASAVVLTGVNSTALTAANFALDPNALAIDGTYAGTTFTVLSRQGLTTTNAPVTGPVTIAADGSITTTDPTAAITSGGALNQATVQVINASGLTASGTTTINIGTSVQNAALASVVGTAGVDNFVFADETALNTPFAGPVARNLTVNGGGGTGVNTLTLSTVGTAVILGDTVNNTLIDIDNVVLTNGSTALVTTNAAIVGAVAVSNASATAGAQVNLGGVGDSYTSSSSGVDVVTLGAAGTLVTVSGGGADNVNTSTANSLGSSYTGSVAGTETLTFLDNNGGAAINLGATASATQMAISGVDTVVLAAGANTLNITPGQNIAINASAAGPNTTTINGTGNTITVAQANNALAALTLTGTSAFVVNATNADSDVTSTSSGSLTVNMADGGGGAISTISSLSATTVNAAAAGGNDDILIIDQSGNFTVTNADGLGEIRVFATHTGTTSVDYAGGTPGNTSFSALLGAGAITIDASGLAASNLTIGNNGTINNTAAVTINGVVGTVGNVLVSNTANDIGALTINGDDASARTITTGDGADIITITDATGNGVQTITTNAGGDTVNLTGTTGANVVVTGAGVDTITTGLAGTTVTAGTEADIVTVNSVAGVDTYILANGDTGANNTAGAFVGTAFFDKVTGLAAGDILNIAVGGPLAVIASTAAVTGFDDSIVFTRGNYDAVAQVFTASAAGVDSLATYDLTAGGGTDFEAIVLRGFIGSATTALGGGNTLVTLT